MNTDFLITLLALFATSFALTSGIVCYIYTRRMSRDVTMLSFLHEETMRQSSAVIRALANRLNPHGHIDLSKEELDFEQLELNLVPWEGGLRVLVK